MILVGYSQPILIPLPLLLGIGPFVGLAIVARVRLYSGASTDAISLSILWPKKAKN